VTSGAVTALAAAAHERWFIPSEDYPVRWGDLLEPSNVVATVAAAGVAAIVTAVWLFRRREPVVPGPLALGATPERLALLLGWVPFLLAAHVAVPLLVSGVEGRLFVPNLTLALPARAFAGVLEIAVALLLFYGLFARAAGVALAALWALGLLIFGPTLLLEQAIVLGFAFFFFAVGRGPVAVDRVFGPWAGAREDLLPAAVPVLRIATGASIAFTAFTEKLANVPLGVAFLEAYPKADVLQGMGLGTSHATFVLVAGAVELALGLLLVTGAFPRMTILVLWLPSNLTLTLFGWRELVGHLPIYAVMALLLLWGSGGRVYLEALRAGLIPLAQKPVGAGVRREGR
jgi:hypothetical protein